MITAYFDGSFSYDDPNLRWGDPAYLLEPGDAGYVWPPTPKPTTKKKKMKRSPFYPLRQGDQAAWLGNFKSKLSGYATVLGLTTAQVTANTADCGWLIYVLLTWLPAVRSYAQSATDALAEAQTGTGSSVQVLPVFTAPALPTGVAAVNPGALNRIFTLVQTIKDAGKATDNISADLQIVGSTQSGPDLATVQPVISATLSGAHVPIKWGWGGHSDFLDSCEIQVDRGDGHGYGLLTIDTTPNYTDTQAFPASATRWSYRAIYRVNDAQVGVWSQPVSVIVPG